jgi:hypothetical protein
MAGKDLLYSVIAWRFALQAKKNMANFLVFSHFANALCKKPIDLVAANW